MGNFKAFNLNEITIKSLNIQGFYSPSDIQEKVIPKALKGSSLLVQSPTGSGKTLSFVTPIIDRLNYSSHTLQAVVVSPTRELARQIFDVFTGFKNQFPELKVRLLSSEANSSDNIDGLGEAPHVVVGTPGRLNDILIKTHQLNLLSIKTLVLDEADMLLDMGYQEEIDALLEGLKASQIMVFSATLKENLKTSIKKYIEADFILENGEEKTSNNVAHHLVNVRHMDRTDALIEFLKIKNPYFALVFCNTKEEVNKTLAVLKGHKYEVGMISGDLSTRERKSMLRRIKNNDFQIVVCSDLASRGMDFADVTDVINLDLPNELEYYFHRAGRTGRFDKTGDSYVFYDVDKTKKALSLIKQGINFDYLIIKNGELQVDKPIIEKRKNKKEDEELTSKIKKAKHLATTKQVKPGYKKKVKAAIDKVKRKHKREIIRQDIRKQRVERYKQEAKNNVR